MAEFKQLHEFLEERERLLLAQLKDLDDEINDHSEKLLARLLEKLSSFDKLIKEMEEKQEQPVDEFFQVSIGGKEGSRLSFEKDAHPSPAAPLSSQSTSLVPLIVQQMHTRIWTLPLQSPWLH